VVFLLIDAKMFLIAWWEVGIAFHSVFPGRIMASFNDYALLIIYMVEIAFFFMVGMIRSWLSALNDCL
jgi:hypothetical protein